MDSQAVDGGLAWTELTSWHLSAPGKLTRVRRKTNFIKIWEKINLYVLLHFHWDFLSLPHHHCKLWSDVNRELAEGYLFWHFPKKEYFSVCSFPLGLNQFYSVKIKQQSFCGQHCWGGQGEGMRTCGCTAPINCSLVQWRLSTMEESKFPFLL